MRVVARSAPAAAMAAKAPKKEKKEPAKTGVPGIDEAMGRIRAARSKVRDELKSLRAEYKKDSLGLLCQSKGGLG